MSPDRPALRYALFDTPIGRCGIGWSESGLVRVQLPEKSDRETARRLGAAGRRSEPPPWVGKTIRALVRHLNGKPQCFEEVPLDLSGLPAFRARVLRAALNIPAGSTASYGELAASLGVPGAARAVGQALGANPLAILVPCHRVLGAAGTLGGFSAHGGAATKRRLLSLEGVPTGPTDGSGEVALAHLRQADPALAPLFEKVGPFALKLEQTRSTFAALCEAILYQQLSGKAAATITRRFLALFPRSWPTPEGLGLLSDQALRGCGLSRNKLLALRDLAQKTLEGLVPAVRALRQMSDEEIIGRLTQVRGIGRWTAQMLLIFRLGRLDVLASDDYGLRKGFSLAYRKRALPSPRQLEAYAERWRPYRTVASWYLWRAVDAAPSD